MVENLAWAAGYNIVAIPLAAGALAWAGITLSPAVGAILMSLSTIVVALNAQLLRRVDLTSRPEQHPSACRHTRRGRKPSDGRKRLGSIGAQPSQISGAP